MKKLLFVTMLCLMALVAQAQVTGHTYYCWEGMLGTDIDVEVLVEMPSDSKLAVGEIIYHRKNGKTSAIKIFGERNSDEKNGDEQTTYIFSERLQDGTVSGILELSFKNGRYDNGSWRTVTGDRSYPFSVTQNKAFPYSRCSTYFTPLMSGNPSGVYRSVWKKADGGNNEFVVTINNKRYDPDRPGEYLTTSIVNDEVILSYPTAPTEGGSRLHVTAWWGSWYDALVFEDFLYLDFVEGPDERHEAAHPEGFYMRQKAEKYLAPFTEYYGGEFHNGMWAHLKDGKVTVTFQEEKVRLYLDNVIDDLTMCPDGSEMELQGVAGPVKDIYINHIGYVSHPILSLLLEDGRVQIFSFHETAERGSLQVSAPLWNMQDITGFTTRPSDPEATPLPEEYLTYYAIDYAGDTHRVQPCEAIFGEWAADKNNDPDNVEQIWIEMTEEWTFYYNSTTVHPKSGKASDVVNFYGNCAPVEGQPGVYHYLIESTRDSREAFEEQPRRMEGTFRCGEWEADTEGESYMPVTPLTGKLLFGAPKPGREVRMKRVHSVG